MPGSIPFSPSAGGVQTLNVGLMATFDTGDRSPITLLVPRGDVTATVALLLLHTEHGQNPSKVGLTLQDRIQKVPS